ncbi:MAG: GNAT family N-acetyltransferase [Clostridia bacterium]|nr:GNAT family N-acetyltransferase [Clostridia bacterium]
MYRKLQSLLPEFTIEPVTMNNLSAYESVFYNNREYYCLTDGHPATRDICEDTICGDALYHVHSIGISQNGQAVSFISVLDGYPDANTLYIGLLLVDERFKRQSIGTSIVKALFTAAADLKFKNVRLSVQENNIGGLNFWIKLGFYEIDRCACDGFDNLSMKYDI